MWEPGKKWKGHKSIEKKLWNYNQSVDHSSISHPHRRGVTLCGRRFLHAYSHPDCFGVGSLTSTCWLRVVFIGLFSDPATPWPAFAEVWSAASNKLRDRIWWLNTLASSLSWESNFDKRVFHWLPEWILRDWAPNVYSGVWLDNLLRNVPFIGCPASLCSCLSTPLPSPSK